MRKALRTGEKYVTMSAFEKSMVNIARAFEKVDDRFRKIEDRLDRHEQILERIMKELQILSEGQKEIRKSIVNIEIGLSRYDRKLEELTLRVERLESKLK